MYHLFKNNKVNSKKIFVCVFFKGHCFPLTGTDMPVASLVLIFTATTIDLRLAFVLYTSTRESTAKGHGTWLQP